jgi:hypothetical protein
VIDTATNKVIGNWTSGPLNTKVSRRLGMNAETLRNWIRRQQVDDGKRDGLSRKFGCPSQPHSDQCHGGHGAGMHQGALCHVTTGRSRPSALTG